MRHQRSRLRLNQKPDHARLLQRNLVTSLLLYESIRTTQKRAQVIAPIIDRLITTAKTKEPHVAIRSINRIVTDKNASRKLMEVLKERYAARPSGFTTVRVIGSRKGDGAHLVQCTLMDAVIATPDAPKKKQKAVEKKQPTQPKSPTPPTKSTKKPSHSSDSSPQ